MSTATAPITESLKKIHIRFTDGKGVAREYTGQFPSTDAAMHFVRVVYRARSAVAMEVAP